MTEARIYDALIIGAGHNGLICAAYLAQAGLEVLVLERRNVVGGAAVTEEIAPGFRVSTASYSLSLLRPDVHRDLQLAERGLVIAPKDPQMFVLLPDGKHFFVWRDEAHTVEELKRINPRDAEAYPRWIGFWEEAVSLLRPLVEDPEPPSLEQIEKTLSGRGREDVWRLAVTGSVAETVSEFFEDEAIRGSFASQGIIGTNSSPHDPGTAWVMAYHYLGGELSGATGTWAYVIGGMGALSRALAAAAQDFGAEIRTGAEAGEVLIEGGRAVGVRMSDGSTHRASVVVSNADPHRTFEGLVPSGAIPADFMERVSAWRTEGCVVKVNLALSELPDFAAYPGTGPGPQHAGTIEISPSIDYLERAHADAKGGAYSTSPFMEVYIQSAVDPSVTNNGHVLSAFTQFAPQLGRAQWHRIKPAVEETVISTLCDYAPNVRDAVVASQLLGPHDLEERFGLTGGDIFHGSILPDQCFAARFDYRTPVNGLYLCGSGARPGGGVMGAAGRNAAKALLQDLRRSAGDT